MEKIVLDTAVERMLDIIRSDSELLPYTDELRGGGTGIDFKLGFTSNKGKRIHVANVSLYATCVSAEVGCRIVDQIQIRDQHIFINHLDAVEMCSHLLTTLCDVVRDVKDRMDLVYIYPPGMEP
jgi:hypothetical protein